MTMAIETGPDAAAGLGRPMRVLHVITGLEDGGAEAVLYRLCTAPGKRVEHVVISLSSAGKYGELLKTEGIRTYALGLRPGRPNPLLFWKLFAILRREQPDVLQTWMYHANLLGTLAAKLAGHKTIFWNIHHTDLEKGAIGRSTMLVNRLCATLSGVPTGIVACAHAAVPPHVSCGYQRNKFIVIPNGYDVGEFAPDPAARTRIRRELGLDDAVPLVGLVGRWNPQKDHRTLISAVARVRGDRPDLVLVLVGLGCDTENAELTRLVADAGLGGAVRLLGQRSDIPVIMNGLDVHILSSRSEAFPNVVAEAMACGTPCIVTRVGDAAEIVGDTGWSVPPSQPFELAKAIRMALVEMVDRDAWDDRRTHARDRIVSRYSLENMVEKYQALWATETVA